METERRARQLESESKWREAAQCWMSINRQNDANTCMHIAEATEAGDAFREDVDRKIGPEPEFTPTNVNAWQKWHKDLNEIYNQHFRK